MSYFSPVLRVATELKLIIKCYWFFSWIIWNQASFCVCVCVHTQTIGRCIVAWDLLSLSNLLWTVCVGTSMAENKGLCRSFLSSVCMCWMTADTYSSHVRCTLQTGKLCLYTADVWWRGVKYFVVRKTVESSEVSVNLFLLLCDICWLHYEVQDTCVKYIKCVCFLSGKLVPLMSSYCVKPF